MTKHAPGPWEVVEQDNNEDIYFIEPNVAIIERCVNDPSSDIANARLIAAAPDLLDALQYMLEVCPAIDQQGEEAHQQARAAIATATGEPA
jgi:hypothetical protein